MKQFRFVLSVAAVFVVALGMLACGTSVAVGANNQACVTVANVATDQSPPMEVASSYTTCNDATMTATTGAATMIPATAWATAGSTMASKTTWATEHSFMDHNTGTNELMAMENVRRNCARDCITSNNVLGQGQNSMGVYEYSVAAAKSPPILGAVSREANLVDARDCVPISNFVINTDQTGQISETEWTWSNADSPPILTLNSGNTLRPSTISLVEARDCISNVPSDLLDGGLATMSAGGNKSSPMAMVLIKKTVEKNTVEVSRGAPAVVAMQTKQTAPVEMKSVMSSRWT